MDDRYDTNGPVLTMLSLLYQTFLPCLQIWVDSLQIFQVLFIPFVLKSLQALSWLNIGYLLNGKGGTPGIFKLI